ncbi:MAG: ribosome maturation factor RimP [Firmicutes bacterium]|nr:ribosome maturation factor RimP [Bacillota bacterium]MCL2255913.1 ribosome maturation factor RimP [Bacillota bacterium]
MNIDLISEKIKPVIDSLGYELCDVEFKKLRGEKHLSVYIDIPTGISLDDCEKVHLAIDPVIEELTASFEEMYYLNVSSPGLDRPFKKQRDFERNYGREVEVKLYAQIKGKKYLEGVLIEKREHAVVLEIKGEKTTVEMTRIALVRPLVKFDQIT